MRATTLIANGDLAVMPFGALSGSSFRRSGTHRPDLRSYFVARYVSCTSLRVVTAFLLPSLIPVVDPRDSREDATRMTHDVTRLDETRGMLIHGNSRIPSNFTRFSRRSRCHCRSIFPNSLLVTPNSNNVRIYSCTMWNQLLFFWGERSREIYNFTCNISEHTCESTRMRDVRVTFIRYLKRIISW